MEEEGGSEATLPYCFKSQMKLRPFVCHSHDIVVYRCFTSTGI
jgi:hypothetical protein